MNETCLAFSRVRHTGPRFPFTRGSLARLGATEGIIRRGASGGLGRARELLNPRHHPSCLCLRCHDQVPLGAASGGAEGTPAVVTLVTKREPSWTG